MYIYKYENSYSRTCLSTRLHKFMIFNLITQYVLRHLTTIYIDSKEEKCILKGIATQNKKNKRQQCLNLLQLEYYFFKAIRM
ncbi:hypothetical protein SAMN05444280_10138 [Tangfeifania diversioriginum]|uniref:Uncharacterized protein n=1 Tax=Tangfeifania diversioriginum TaxID=1168035 RepID=A0A1M6A2T8_9BACT|nr:hypothetical protein SAMN05444280_10138 [Tangfeifania diversioriginum]